MSWNSSFDFFRALHCLSSIVMSIIIIANNFIIFYYFGWQFIILLRLLFLAWFCDIKIASWRMILQIVASVNIIWEESKTYFGTQSNGEITWLKIFRPKMRKGGKRREKAEKDKKIYHNFFSTKCFLPGSICKFIFFIIRNSES